jgi:hypothetical protein
MRPTNKQNETQQAKAQKSFVSLALILAGIALVAEILIFRAMVTGYLPVAIGLFLHLLLAGVLIMVALGKSYQAHHASHMLMLTGIAVAFLGPLGAFGILMMMVALSIVTHQSMEEWFAGIFPNEVHSAGEELAEHINRYQARYAERQRMTPFMEVLMLGTTEQKQAMIGRMTRRFSPSFMPALKLALRDPDNSVRVQAANAMALLDTRFQQALTRAKATHEMEQSAMSHLGLARLYDAYAFLGVSDPKLVRDYRKLALEHYQAYHKEHPQDDDASLAIARLYHRLGQTQTMVEWLETKLGRDRVRTNPRALLWLMEGYAEQHAFDKVREIANDYKGPMAMHEIPPALQSVLVSWGGDATALPAMESAKEQTTEEHSHAA